MKTIGIRELKARLSGILRDVQGGEVVLITDRGRVVAELRAPGHAPPAASRSDRALSQLASSGALRLRETTVTPYEASPLRAPAGAALQLLDELRDEAGAEGSAESVAQANADTTNAADRPSGTGQLSTEREGGGDRGGRSQP